MFLIALSPIKDETMKTIQEPITRTPIFIGRWTPHICFRLKRSPIDMESCAAVSEGCHSGR